MPSNPDKPYKHDGWQGYGHWLGTGNACVRKENTERPPVPVVQEPVSVLTLPHVEIQG